MSKRLLIAAVAVILLALPITATAAGPYDGVYAVTLTPASGPVISNFAMVSQNGTTFLLITLNLDGTWTYGTGTIAGSTASGTLFLLNGQAFGAFQISAGGGALSGQAVVAGTSYVFSASQLY